MRNQWSARRKTVISLSIFFALLIIVGLPAYFASRNTPNCSNGKQDGDETGIDCGGACALICAPEILPLVSRGDARLLKVASSTYEIVVLIENPNVSGSVKRAPYLFKVYSGTERKPIKVFERETYVAPNATFALFEGPFTLEGSGPFRATFEWADLVWEKADTPQALVSVGSINLITASGTPPRLEARLTDKSQENVSNIEAVALLTNTAGNIVAAGKTFVENIAAGGSAPIVFTWPADWNAEAVSVRILPHILPDKSYLH